MTAKERVVVLLRNQAGHCAALGSPLYGALLEKAADDAAADGPILDLLRHDPAPGPRGDALGLRLMAAAHRLALQGRAPELAAFLPSTRRIVDDPIGSVSDSAIQAPVPRGLVPVATSSAPVAPTPAPVATATATDAAWLALRDLVVTRGEELRPLVARPCQTNEVGRTAALAVGFFEAARTGLPLRLLEVGASAGLNLRFDHFLFGGGGVAWGPAESPVDLRGLWLEPPILPSSLEVAERLGCDLRPVDALGEDGQLSLLSSVWADQGPRFTRLRGALAIARRVAARVDAADVAAWLPARLAAPRPGCATVVYHSIVDEYFPDATRSAFHATLREAGARATPEAPLFWLRLEPFADQRTYGVTLTSWPGGAERLLALSGPHGSHVRAVR